MEDGEKFCPKCGSSSAVNRNEEALNNIAAYNESITIEQPKKAKKKKLGKILLISLGAVVALALLTIFVIIPEINYNDAYTQFNNGNYESAYYDFLNLGDYKDSSDMAMESKYLWANSCQEAKQYDRAYHLFVELGDYKQSEGEVAATAMLWVADALGSEDEYKVANFCNRVSLTDYDVYSLVYGTTVLYINGHTDAEYWFDWGPTIPAENVIKVLNKIPSTYENTATYLRLFNTLSSADTYAELFRDNESTMRQCWSLEFVQDLAEQDQAITYFLEGYWTTYSGGFYLSFYENDNGSTTCSFDLPWVAKPSGTKYYDIEDLIFYWDGGNDNHLAKVYRFEIVDYDTITAFCYKNNRTYTLYR